MRRASALAVSFALVFATVSVSVSVAQAQSPLQRPDDGINDPQISPDPMLDGPFVGKPHTPSKDLGAPQTAAAPSARKLKGSALPAGAPGPHKSAPNTSHVDAAPSSTKAPPASPDKKKIVEASAKPSAPAAAEGGGPNISFRQCADSYFAGASLLHADPDAVDTLLQRAQIAGERVLKVDAGLDQAKLVQAIKLSGTARAAEIRALDNTAGPKAAIALFKIIRACDAKLALSITPELVFGVRGPAPADTAGAPSGN